MILSRFLSFEKGTAPIDTLHREAYAAYWKSPNKVWLSVHRQDRYGGKGGYMEETAVYGRLQPISDVVGRVDYISNHDRQECLLAVAGQRDPDFWRLLAEDSQQAWRESGGDRKEKRACEAREIQLLLPRKVLDMGPSEQKDMLQSMEQMLREKYGMTCVLGLHLSKTENNVHVHILFSERLRLSAPKVTYASRNTYLDECGVKKRTKKEILDKGGAVRKGCKIIPKGEVLSVRYFGDKEPLFADRDWCGMMKQDMADWINGSLEPDKKRVVFDSEGPYLAQVHIGKGKATKSRKKKTEYNKEVKAFNAIVEAGIVDIEKAHHAKSWIMLSPDRLSALGSVLAGILLEYPESRCFVAGTLLAKANNEELKYIQKIATGGERTETTGQTQKESLRRLYREAERLRQQARETEAELEKKQLMAQARQCSMRIDKLRKDMGLYKDKDYKNKLKLIDEEITRRNRRVMFYRSRANKVIDIMYYKKRELNNLKKELYSWPIFFKSEQEKREEQRLQQKIKHIEEDIERLEDEEKTAVMRYLYVQMMEKKENKRLKEERNQLRLERRRNKKNIKVKER